MRASVHTPLAVLLFVVAAGCNRSGDDAERIEQTLAGLDLPARVAQLIVPALSPTSANADSLASALTAERPAYGAVWIHAGEAAGVARLTTALDSAAGVPLLVMADLDEGVGGLLGRGSDLPPVGHLLSAADEDEVQEVAALLAAEASALGIHLGAVSPPAVSGGFPHSLLQREREPEMLSQLLDDASTKELPLAISLFNAPGDSEALRWDRARLDAFELPLLDAAHEDGALLVVGSAVIPALSGDSAQLSESRSFYTALRREHDWQAPAVADLRGSAEGSQAAARSISAGADMVIVDGDPAEAKAAVIAALEAGSISEGRIEAAVRRVLILKNRHIGRARVAIAPDSALALLDRSSAEMADLSRTLAERLTYRRTGEILPAAGRGVVVFDPEQQARSFVGAIGEASPMFELAAGGDRDSTVGALAQHLARAPTLIVVGTRAESFAAADSLVSALPDSLRAAARLVRVALGPDAIGEEGQPQLDVFSWGAGRASQLAAVQILYSDGNLDQGRSYAFAPTLRFVDADSIGMDAARLDRVDRLLREALADSVFSAAAVIVARRGGVALMRGYGRAAENAGQVDPRSTLFDIASLSKVLGTTTAAAVLIESDQLELDAPVGRYISEFRGEYKENATIRHLLAHTAGLPPGLQLYYDADSREEALAQVIAQPLRRPPGVEPEYSDLGMMLLAEVIERITETPIDRLLARHLFVPLGMSSTMYLPPLSFRDDTAPTAINTERPFVLQGVVHDGNAFRLGGRSGHAGIFSTAWEVAVFSQMMLNGGVYGATRVLQEETVRELTSRQPNAGERALGWDTPAERSSAGRFLSSRSYGHTGYTGTSIWIDPLRELFVVLLTNRTYTEAPADEILDLRIGVHEAAVQAITDRTISRRPGAR